MAKPEPKRLARPCFGRPRRQSGRSPSAIRARARRSRGAERLVNGAPRLTALVIDQDGRRAGFQDKVQLDPSEESIYSPGTERHCFRVGALTFGVAICLADRGKS